MATKITLELDDQTGEGLENFEDAAEQSFATADDAVQQVIDKLDELAESQEKIEEGQKQISAAAISAMSNTADQFGKAGQAAIQFTGQVATSFATTESQAQAVTAAVSAINQSFNAMRQVHSVIDGISRAKQFLTSVTVAQTAANQGLVASNAAAATSTNAVTVAVNTLRAALLANPITAILVGIGAAAASVAAAYAFFRSSKNDVDEHTQAIERNRQHLARLREGVQAIKRAQEEWAALMRSGEVFEERVEVQEEINEIQKLGLQEIAEEIRKNEEIAIGSANNLKNVEQELMKERIRLENLKIDARNEENDVTEDLRRTNDRINELLGEQLQLSRDLQGDKAILNASRHQALQIEEELARIRDQEISQSRDAAVQQMQNLDEVRSALEQQRQIRQELIDQGNVMGEAFRNAEADIQRLSRREQELQTARQAAQDQTESARIAFQNEIISHEQRHQDELRRSAIAQEGNLDKLARMQRDLQREYEKVRKEAESIANLEGDSEDAAERINDLKRELNQIEKERRDVAQQALRIEEQKEQIAARERQRQEEEMMQAMMAQMGDMSPLAQQFAGQIDPRDIGLRAAEQAIDEQGLREAMEAAETPAERKRAQNQIRQLRRQMVRQAREGTLDQQQVADATGELAQEMIQRFQQEGRLNDQTAQALQAAVEEMSNQQVRTDQIESAIRQVRSTLDNLTNNSRRRAQQGGLR